MRSNYRKTIADISPLVGEICPNGRYLKLTQPFTFRSRGHKFTAPRGWISQFTHTPRFIWTFLPPQGQYSFAATAHDFLYEIDPLLRSTPVSRAEADAIFLDLMKRSGVGLIRYPMFWAVRVFGWIYWAEDRMHDDGQ